MTRPQKLLATVAVLSFVSALLCFTRLGANLMCYVAFSDYYAIPEQSSIFTFKPTAWFGEGSGDWWTYGEDNNNFYFWEWDGRGFLRISKHDAAGIPDFSPTDIKTWKPPHTP